MTKIKGIRCQVLTSPDEDSGTDGDIYLGICGREFHLDSSSDDFERNSWREYILGAPPAGTGGPSSIEAQVRDKDMNDPRIGLPLDTSNLGRSPVYIRFEPQTPDGDHWKLYFAAALVYDTKFVTGYTPPEGFDQLWLGHKAGKIVYLTEEHATGGEAKLLASVHKVAARMRK